MVINVKKEIIKFDVFTKFVVMNTKEEIIKFYLLIKLMAMLLTS